MSHFTSLRTQMVDPQWIQAGLRDMGYSPIAGPVSVRGYSGGKTSAEFKISTPSNKYDIGFQKRAEAYDIVADWWGIQGIKQQQFVRQLTQRYAYHATKAKLAEQGFSLVSEETQQTGQIHLVLRRMA